MGLIQRTRYATSLSSLSLLTKKGYTPLRVFSADLRAAYYARSQPSQTQQSELSSAQQLVRSARRSIIEPILSSFDRWRVTDARTPREKEQLRRRMRSETMAGGPYASRVTHSPRPDRPTQSSAYHRLVHLQARRRPSPTNPRRPMPPPTAKKSRSVTYTQAWSVSEQRLTERVLSEIPDSEKMNRYERLIFLAARENTEIFTYCRWPKISKAVVVIPLCVRQQVACKSILNN